LIEGGSITWFGDRGLVISFDGHPSTMLTQHLVALCAVARKLEGVVDAIPGHQTALLEIDPTQRDAIRQSLQSLSLKANNVTGEFHSIAIRYDGPDADWACDHLQMERDKLVRLHSSKTYDVRMLGSPKFVYLSSVSRELSLPRLDDPRIEVPAGSVGIGGRQTGIYAMARPGGWRLIARALSEIPDLSAGDRVKFVPQ
jgi:KipI family sensor histidine kinase inhibitor